PPVLFETVVGHLAESNCATGARVIVEKPFGHDLASAQELNKVLLGAFDEADVFRIDHYLGKRAVNNLLAFRFANTFVEAFWNRHYIESVEIAMAEDFGVQVRGGFYDHTGTISDVVENHLRLRLSPEVTIAMEMMTLAPAAEGLSLQSGEMVASHSLRADEMDAYERVLGAAMAGDSTLFAREDYVEEAWRIVEPVLKKSTPVYQYAPNTWGPDEVARVTPPGGWSNPNDKKALAVAGEAA